MSIDAKIRSTERVPEGLRLNLEPRYNPGTGHFTLAGQKALTILEPVTWEPPAGLAIWGNSGRVYIVVDGKDIPYDRDGYTRLRERKAP